MCGILGRFGGEPRAMDLDALRGLLGHRGPDGAGIERRTVVGREVLLGHTRLSVVDTSAGAAQPMASRSGRWLLSFNGEIYNHLDLRRELDGPFDSHGDSRTLVEAIDRWGVEGTLPRLNGIFAFAALDLVEGSLFLARDPFGVKPLYHQDDGAGLNFASEVSALAALADARLDVDRTALGQFLLYRHVPSPRTLWRGVRRVPPGHYLRFRPGERRADGVMYASLGGERFQGSETEAAARYAALAGAAVGRQLMSDVPVGILLSGGVDSALVAALACERGAAPTAFTVGFGDQHAECELANARRTAEVLGLRHREVRLDPEAAWSALAPALAAAEEPLGTTSLIPMWSVSALASEEVKVVLTGQGTDELFGGYRRYQGQLLGRWLPRGRAWGLLAAAAAGAPVGGEALERALRAHSRGPEAEHFSEVHALFTERERRAFGVEVRREQLVEPIERWLALGASGAGDSPVERMMAVDARTSLADDLLLYGDRISMAHSVEARVPMLDLDLATFVESLPRRSKLRLGEPKRLHRLVAERLLPEEITRRPKLGFQVPFGEWARGDWRERVEAMLFDADGLARVLDVAKVRELWAEHLTGRRNRERQLFALVSLSAWASGWLGAAAGAGHRVSGRGRDTSSR